MVTTNPVVQFVITLIAILSLASMMLIASRRLHLPYAVCLVITGFCVAQLGFHGPEVFHVLSEVKISHDLIFFVLLPTLVYQSAYEIDSWQLRHNLRPILTLALPGVVISTAIIGGLVGWFTQISILTAFLLGAVLSAIDHVSVMSIFKQMGAPKRLMILFEGESLFSDVTLIVLSYTLLDAVLVDAISPDFILTGIINFFKVLLGGVLIGYLCGYSTAYIVGKIDNSPIIEVSLVIILAYFSFLVAEYGFHVSGVMATAVAGLIMSGWGKTKISPSVHQYLEYIWKYLAFISMSLIFLLVGYVTDYMLLFKVITTLPWVIAAVLIARAVVIFGLMPIVGKLPNSDPVDIRYQIAMYWGGLRGAVALALTMSLEKFAHYEEFMALVTGVVLFTFLVPGLSIRWLIKWLKFDQLSLDEKFAQLEGVLSAKQHGLFSLSSLKSGGMFSASITSDIESRYRRDIYKTRSALKALRSKELDEKTEKRLMLLRCLSEEHTFYFDMFSRCHISEQAYHQVTYSVALQIDALRYKGVLPATTTHPHDASRFAYLFKFARKLVIISTLVEKFSLAGTAREYEQVWARQQASTHILENLEKIQKGSTRINTLNEVREIYQQWNTSAKQRIDQVADQLPEFVTAMQIRLAQRLILHAEREEIQTKMQHGTLPDSLAEKMLESIDSEISVLHGHETEKLRIGKSELLKKVPFFQGISEQDFASIAVCLRSITLPAGKKIITQGEKDHSLFLIARGVIRTSIKINSQDVDINTMIAGDFFGEMALLNNSPRTATCRSITPCVLYELRKKDFEKARKSYPAIELALRATDKSRFEVIKQALYGQNNSVKDFNPGKNS